MATLKEIQEIFSGKDPHEIGLELWDFTMRTTVLEDLTQAEIDRIAQFYASMNKTSAEIYREQLELKEWRSNVLNEATKAGIKQAVSFDSFNKWMLNYSKYKKALNAHNVDELKAVYRQLKQLERNNCKSSQKPMTKKWFEKGIHLKEYN